MIKLPAEFCKRPVTFLSDMAGRYKAGDTHSDIGRTAKCRTIFLTYDLLNHRTGLHHPLEPAAVGRLSDGRCPMSSRMKATTTFYILLIDAT
jgi:hypothetical protein